MKWLHCLFAALLGGCASYSGSGLTPGRATEGDVRATMGPPALEMAEADGSRLLAYPRGPEGLHTFMFRIDAGGRLRSIEQALDEESFRRIQTGVHTRDDVRRLIGPPWRTIEFPNLRQVAWDYRFMDGWGYLTEFSVMIDERGLVAGTVTVRIEPARGDRD